MRKINRIIIISLTSLFIFSSCGSLTSHNEKVEAITSIQPTSVEPSIYIPATMQATEEPVVKEKLYTDEEVDLITQTLAGECYDDKLKDKRLVVEVILNRVSNGKFGDSVFEVVTAKGQFAGYWKQSRPVSESDIRIAEETLSEWYANDCEALSGYLFFCSGPNRENVFRSEY